MRAGSLSEGLSPGPVPYLPMEHGVERKGGPWRTAQSDEPSPRIMDGARRQVMPSRRAPDEPRHAGRRVFARCPRSKRGASHGGGDVCPPPAVSAGRASGAAHRDAGAQAPNGT